MKVKHKEIEIVKENPFVKCKLGREVYANVLTEIVETYAEGFVLAINNEWGTGKTTFVKMWEQKLKNDSFQTVYFNAWENDFDDNPMIAIMSELKGLVGEDKKEIFKSVLEKGAVLAKNIAPALLKALVEKYLDSETLSEGVENTAEGLSEILNTEINEYAEKKQSLQEFKVQLEKFVKNIAGEKPLVFIIDELDRCRPDYAVEVLEKIKHFFSVPGIVFVLSIDKKHLESSVKGFYNSAEINSAEYLRRFIDLEYSIPEPSNENFISYMFEYYSFSDFFNSDARKNNSRFKDDAFNLKLMAERLFNKSGATLRQQEKIFSHTRLVLSLFQKDKKIFPHLLFVLVYLKVMRNDTYKKIENKLLSVQELSDIFFEIIFEKNRKLNIKYFLRIESELLWFYNNDFDYENQLQIISRDVNGVDKITIKSKLNEEEKNNAIQGYVISLAQSYDSEDMRLNVLLKKISLTESANI
jgi:hypothetical protein